MTDKEKIIYDVLYNKDGRELLSSVLVTPIRRSWGMSNISNSQRKIRLIADNGNECLIEKEQEHDPDF